MKIQEADRLATAMALEAAHMANLDNGQLPAIMTALLAVESRLLWLGMIIDSK